MTANALYTNVDQTTELVTLAEDDTLLEVVETLTAEQVDAIHAGEAEYRIVGDVVEVGDGDTFRRLVLR